MDGAPVQTVNATQAAMSQAMTEVRGEVLHKSHQLAHSPDLNPLDYTAWDPL